MARNIASLRRCLIALLTLSIAFGEGGATAAVRDEGSRRVALVVGNATYASLTELPGAAVDAHAMADALRRRGYRVVERIDVDSGALAGLVAEFSTEAAGASDATFVYFGHGAEIDGFDRLLPVDADPARPDTLLVGGVSLAALGSPRRLQVLVDAQRSTGLGGARTFGRVLTGEVLKGEVLVALAAQPGLIARNDKEGHAAFAAALLGAMGDPGLSGEEAMAEVVRRVKSATKDRQTPWFRSNLPPGLPFLGGEPERVESSGDDQGLQIGQGEIETASVQIGRGEEAPSHPGQAADAPSRPTTEANGHNGMDVVSGTPSPSGTGSRDAPPMEKESPDAPPMGKGSAIPQDSPQTTASTKGAGPAPPPDDKAGASPPQGFVSPVVSPPKELPPEKPVTTVLPEPKPAGVTVSSPPVVSGAGTDRPKDRIKAGGEGAPASPPAKPPMPAAATPATPPGSATEMAAPGASLPKAPTVSGGQNDGNTKLASIDPDISLGPPLGSKPPIELQAPMVDVSLDVQHQLQRIGCLSGAVDGAWGKASQKALDQYYRIKKRKGPQKPDANLLARLETERERVCAPPASPVESGKIGKSAPVPPKPKPPNKPTKPSAPTVVGTKPTPPVSPPIVRQEAEATSGRKIKNGLAAGTFHP